MHVLLMADADDKYGASHSMLQMVSALGQVDPSMKRSVVVPKNSTLAEIFEGQGCTVYRIPYKPFYESVPASHWKLPAKYVIRGAEYFWGTIYGLRELEKELNISSVDIIHSNSSRVDLCAILAEKYDKPLLWHIREFGDLDYECYSYRRDYVDLMNSQATKLVAVSDAVREHWIGKGICPEKIIRIYNGVDGGIPQKTNYRKDSSEPLRLVIAGSISETKGQGQLLEAIEKLPSKIQGKIRLDIIGEAKNGYARELSKKIEREGHSDRVRMLGYRQDVCSLLHDYDCGVICSRSEGFGRVTAEYMMAGLPVIASNAGANPELVSDGETGLLYELHNAEDLTEKMIRLLEQPALCERLGRKASQVAEREFSSMTNAQQIYNLYCQILRGGGNPLP